MQSVSSAYLHGVGSRHWKRLTTSAVNPHPPTTASQPKMIHFWPFRLIIRRPTMPDSLQQKREVMNMMLAAYWLYNRNTRSVLLSMILRVAVNASTLKNVSISREFNVLKCRPSPLSHPANTAMDWPIARTCGYGREHTAFGCFAR